MMSENRIGKFYISADLIKDEVFKQIMSGCVIVRAEYLYHKQEFEYIAYNDNFKHVDRAEEVPVYTMTILIADNGVHEVKWS